MRASLARLCAVAVIAAALPTLAAAGGSLKDAPYQPLPQTTWSGPYIGAHVGYAWGSADVTDITGGVPPGPFGYDPDGVLAGGTLGYNWQMDQFVVGVEGDLGYMDLSGSGRIPSSNPAAFQAITLDGGLYAVIAGRLGVTFGSTMIYGKAGWAYFDGEAGQKTTNPGYVTNPTGAFSGAVYGGGIEHFISKGISLKVEYLHFNFGSQGGNQTSVSDPPIGFVYTNKTDLTADSVKVGMAVHF